LDLSHHFSRMANRRTASSVSKIVAAFPAATFNLGPGFPFAGNFPVDSLEGAIAKTWRFPLHPLTAVSLPDLNSATRFTVPKASIDTDPGSEIDLKSALQYQSSTGIPPLADFIQDWAINHQNQGKIPYEGPATLLTGGAQDGLAKCLLTFADDGDAILMEEDVYFSARDAVLPFGVKVIPVKLDEHGISPKSLKLVLDHWDEAVDGKKPHMLYTVSLGQNPTGAITPLWRKKEIYTLCQRHDIIVFEDDPYWALQYDIPGHKGEDPAPNELLSTLAPSYLTIDTDGRVLSLQTFTKIFAPGCRMGWIVAQPAFIEKLTFTTDGTTSNPSGFAEAAVAQVVIREWGGAPGFTRWIAGLRAHYKTRRDAFCEILAEGRDLAAANTGEGAATSPGQDSKAVASKRKRHPAHETTQQQNGSPKKRKTRMYDFVVPAGGMYVWVDFDLKSHPLAHPPHSLSEKDINLRLWNYLLTEHKIIAIPGYVFGATSKVKSADHFMRLTFAATLPDELRVAARLFSQGVKEF
ncbi:pyridoxal phosphate-dependent transferase, partial [Xylariales sp. PMI_506]